MKRKILSMVLAVALMVGVMPGTVFAEMEADQLDTYRVYAWDPSKKELTFTDIEISDVNPTAITDSLGSTTLEGEWYVVEDTRVEIKESISFTRNGDVHLILMDGCTLEVDGITVPSGTTLNIYAQSEGINAGTLISDIVKNDEGSDNAAIGGAGTIIIHGGECNGQCSPYRGFI